MKTRDYFTQKLNNSRKKQKVVKTTKGHVSLGIDFENQKSSYPEVLRKSTTF